MFMLGYILQGNVPFHQTIHPIHKHIPPSTAHLVIQIYVNTTWGQMDLVLEYENKFHPS